MLFYLSCRYNCEPQTLLAIKLQYIHTSLWYLFALDQKASHCHMLWHLYSIFFNPRISFLCTRSSSSPHTSRVTRCFTGRPLSTASLRGSGVSWRYTPHGRTGWWSVSWREEPSTSSKCAPSLMSSRELTARWRWSGRWKKVTVWKLLFCCIKCIYKQLRGNG